MEYVAIDCEMVETVNNNNAVARVTIVNEKGQLLIDEYVKPQSRVIDYRTRFSGITENIILEKGKGKIHYSRPNCNYFLNKKA